MKLKKNIGTIDKVVRLILVAVFAALILTQTVTGVVAIALGLLGAFFLVTSLLNFCVSAK